MMVEWRRVEVESKWEIEWRFEVKVDVIIFVVNGTIFYVVEAAFWFVWLGGRE